MRLFIASFVFSLWFAINAASQGGVKITKSEAPVFSVETGGFLYGDAIKVGVEVDKSGNVKRAVAFGPLVPCANPKDKVAEAIKNAALTAAKSTVFEPQLDNGKAAEFSVMLTYPLTKQKLPVDDQKKANARATSLPKPFFTPEAKNNRIGGAVELQVLIDESGNVLSLTPISGHPALIGGTIDAACNAKFKPALIAGQPSKILSTVTYRFVP